MSKYHRWYHSIMENAQSQERSKKEGGPYYEVHHIVPVSLGGDNTVSNLVLLTAREHYIAHLLLVHLHEGSDKEKMIRASFMMVAKKKEKRYTSRSWAIHREYLSTCLSHNHRNNIPCEIDGIKYRSRKEASRVLGVSLYYLIKQGKLSSRRTKSKKVRPKAKSALQLSSYAVELVAPARKQNIKPTLIIDNIPYTSKHSAARQLGVTVGLIDKLIEGTYVPKPVVVIKGTPYKSINHASEQLGKAPHTIKKMLANPDFVPRGKRTRTTKVT